ncbi:MAG: P-II family nitrogen regulator [Myxococcota bacterium]
MKEIKAIIQPFKVKAVCDALAAIEGLPGVTVSTVLGWGKTRGKGASPPVEQDGHAFARKAKVEVVVTEAMADRVVEAIVKAARTGRVGDGKVFVYDVEQVVKIRTGERGIDAV